MASSTSVSQAISRVAFGNTEGTQEGFTKRYGLARLVFFERHDDIRRAILREKSMKRYPRAWKVRLIMTFNPDWEDLFDRLA